MISSPPTIPERHPHRNTYPPATSTQNSTSIQTSDNTPVRQSTAGMPETSRRVRNRRQAELQRGDEQIENDLEGHLHSLEADRRTWLGRREGGSLDVTPPKEGRFERLLT